MQPIIYYDLLDNEIYTRLLAWPKRIAEDIHVDFSGWMVIDKIQMIPYEIALHRLPELIG